MSKTFQKFLLLLTALTLVSFVSLTFFKKTSPPIKIIPVDSEKTKDWKIYKNPEHHFSFKYPDVLLSNFQVDTNSDVKESIKKLKELKNSKSEQNSGTGATYYNVMFEANSLKFDGTLDEFVKNGPLNEINDLPKQSFESSNFSGLRISNTDVKKADVYFLYNILKNGNYIYNFAILSDDPVLISANAKLLDEIISTVTFN